jgi:glycosyltransferase involved in cell wall biosynthesis
MIKVSIITATFNCEKSVVNCIKSVNSQQSLNYERIYVDGKSSDNTIKLIEKHEKSKYKLISEPDTGIYDALNKGIKMASGDIIGFLHSDDSFNSSSTVSKIVNRINRDNLDGVYGDLNYINPKHSNKIIRKWVSSNFNYSLLKKGWMPPHPTLFLKKEVYLKYGLYDSSFKISADYDFILRILKDRNINIGYLPEVVTNMSIGGASNKNLKNIIIKVKEDYRAIRNNKIGGLTTLFIKNISKLKQFL